MLLRVIADVCLDWLVVFDQRSVWIFSIDSLSHRPWSLYHDQILKDEVQTNPGLQKNNQFKDIKCRMWVLFFYLVQTGINININNNALHVTQGRQLQVHLVALI